MPGSAESEKKLTPACVLPEMMLRAAGVVPPMTLNVPPMAIPTWLRNAAVPATLVPIRLPRTMLPCERIRIPPPLLTAPMLPETTFCSIVVAPAKSTMPKSKPSMNRPRIVPPGVWSVARPQRPGLPLSSISGVPAYPGCEVPSRMTALGQHRQSRLRRNRVHAAAGNVERDPVDVVDVRVRFEDRLPQRPGAAVVGVGHDQRAARCRDGRRFERRVVGRGRIGRVRQRARHERDGRARERRHVDLEIEGVARGQRRQRAGDLLIRERTRRARGCRCETRGGRLSRSRGAANRQVQRGADSRRRTVVGHGNRVGQRSTLGDRIGRVLSGDRKIAGRLTAGAEQYLDRARGIPDRDIELTVAVQIADRRQAVEILVGAILVELACGIERIRRREVNWRPKRPAALPELHGDRRDRRMVRDQVEASVAIHVGESERCAPWGRPRRRCPRRTRQGHRRAVPRSRRLPDWHRSVRPDRCCRRRSGRQRRAGHRSR